MWKIKNNTNKQYLNNFETEIIIPIFNMIHEVVIDIENGKIKLPLESKDIWKETDVFLKLSDSQKNLFSYIMQKTVSFEKLQDLFCLIVSKYNSPYVQGIFNIYTEQKSKVVAGNYDIMQINIDEYFKKLFVNYFYNTFFADDFVWETLAGERYNRKSFHKNFKLENKMVVCPYCDIDTTIAIPNNNVEHFLPKSKYPLLAMNPLNLISSCYACNKGDGGKGDRIPDFPITSPYNEMIGDFAEFDVDFISKEITLINKGGKAQENYFNFLKLYTRYSDLLVFESVDHAAESLFETLCNYSTPTTESIDLYIQRRERMENLSFVLKSIIGKYPQYEAYQSI